MNRFLADALGKLNALIAGVIILLGVIIGLASLFSQSGGFFIMLGSILGSIVVAVLVCGLLALVIDIRNSNREILEQLRNRVS
jgi:hypothetical protein